MDVISHPSPLVLYTRSILNGWMHHHNIPLCLPFVNQKEDDHMPLMDTHATNKGSFCLFSSFFAQIDFLARLTFFERISLCVAFANSLLEFLCFFYKSLGSQDEDLPSFFGKRARDTYLQFAPPTPIESFSSFARRLARFEVDPFQGEENDVIIAMTTPSPLHLPTPSLTLRMKAMSTSFKVSYQHMLSVLPITKAIKAYEHFL